MISFFIKSTFFLLVFYGIYKLFLEKTNMHCYKRFYLVTVAVFSFIFPFITFTIQATAPAIFNSGLPIHSGGDLPTLFILKEEAEYAYRLMGYRIYGLITLLVLLRFVWNIYYFFKERKNGINIKKGAFELILVDYPIAPHSFLSWIFVSSADYHKGIVPQEVLWHEEAHIRQKHTIDVLLIELLLMFFWFQPMLYFFRKAIKNNHEFMADEVVIKRTQNIANYQNYLLDSLCPTKKISKALSSAFLFNLTKKRLIMMTTKTTAVRKNILSVMPFMILGILFSVFSCAVDDDSKMSGPTKAETVHKEVHTLVDVKAEPTAGIQNFYRTFLEKFRLPAGLQNEFFVKATVKFIVEEDGTLTNFNVLKGSKEVGNAIVHTLQEMPAWKPAEKEGEIVRSSFVLPVTIKTNNG